MQSEGIMSSMYNVASLRSDQNLQDNEKVLVVDLEDQILGECYIDEDIVDLATSVLVAYVSNKEVDRDELINGNKPSNKCATMDDIQEEKEELFLLDRALDLHDRLNKGMSMIKECDVSRLKYIAAKKRFDKAKDVMFADDTNKPRKWWLRFYQLRDERNAAWTAYKANSPRLQRLWDHWMDLNSQFKELMTPHMWVLFYQHLNSNINPYLTRETDMGDESVDSRFSPSDEIYRDTYLEESSKENEEVFFPVQSYGYVSRCKDLTAEWLDAIESSTMER